MNKKKKRLFIIKMHFNINLRVQALENRTAFRRVFYNPFLFISIFFFREIQFHNDFFNPTRLRSHYFTHFRLSPNNRKLLIFSYNSYNPLKDKKLKKLPISLLEKKLLPSHVYQAEHQ